jgi:hypothetical protein
MGGILQVDTIQNNNATTLITQTNSTTLTFGVSGQNIVIPSGVTFNTASATVNLPTTIKVSTIQNTNSTNLITQTNVTTITFGATSQTISVPSVASFASTIGVGGATPAASGAGITFPGTQSASTDANTLDDYEEGTFNLTLEGTGTNFSSITYESRTGYYIKIGNTVYININFSTTALSGGSGDTRLNGLPFTSGVAASFALNYFANWGGDYPFGGVVFNGTTSIYPYYRTASNGAATVMQVSDYGTGGSANNMVLTGFYKV